MKYKRGGGKKFLALLLSVVMVSQMYAMPVQSAFAAGADEEEQAAEADDLATRAGGYNGTADYREVSSGIAVTVYKDAALSEELGDEPVVDGAHLYGKLNIDFSEDEQPTLASPNIKYTFPNNVNFTNKGEQSLYDSSNNVAGTWRIENGAAYLHYNEDWLRTHPSGCTAYVGFDFAVQESGKGDGDQVIIAFPGTGTSVTVNIKDGDVAGNKFGANPNKEWELPVFDSTDNTYTWTVRVSPATVAHDLKIYDTVGSNLEFVDGSFTLVDKDGNPVSGTCDASVNGQEATISLGTLTKGDYYVQYKTKVKQSALDALKDGEELSDIGNSVRWTWGTSNEQEGQSHTVYPQAAKYAMVSKYAAGGSANENINWTVKLNTGTLKADMSGYVFTDTLDAGQKFKAGAQYTVTDAAGKTVVTGDVDPSSSKLVFTLPVDLGKQELTVTYATEMADPASSKSVSNTATVTPSNGTGVGGGATATYQPSDSRTYISKELVQKGNDENGGKASWISTVYFSVMESDTDPSKVVFSDHIQKDPWQQIKFSDVVLKVAGTGQTLTAGTDYEITNDGQWGSLQITFKSSDLTRSLIGAGDVVVSYNTDCGTGAGTYTNTSSVAIDNVKKGEAKASYEVKAEAKVPFSKKSSGNAWWNADYVWADGTKGAWIADWTIHANCDEPNDWTHTAAGDLKGADVVIKDTLGEGMEYVGGSSRYWLRGANGFKSVGDWPTLTAEPTSDGNVATFTVPTVGVVNDEGSWNGYVELKYQTAIKPSAVEPGETKVFSNTAEGSAGEKSFPETTATTTVANKVLDKQAQRASDGSHVTYTISVNPNAQTIGDADTLTLTDTMSATASFTKGTLSVKDANGNEVTEGVSYALKNKANDDGSTSTVLTITLPNSKALTITYDVAPQGAVGDEVEISNSVVIEGYASSAANHSQKWIVNKSNAGTDAVSYGITISKTGEDGKTVLDGAEFMLYKVDLDASTPGNIVKEPAEVAGANPKATDASGLVSFGDKDDPLAANTLYCFVETKAPDGYKISNTEPTYVMFSGTSIQDKKDYATALAKAKALGITPNAGMSFNVFDEKSDEPVQPEKPEVTPVSVSLAAQKVLTGRDLAGDEFSFELKDGATVVATASNDADGNVLFPAISYAAPGEHDYTISEVAGNEAGVSYDTATHKAHVSVTQDATTGKLSAEVTYENGAVPTFRNVYEQASGEFRLGLVKTVNGAQPKAGESFAFTATAEGENADDAPALGEVTTDAEGKAAFDVALLSDKDAGKTYTYRIHETSELADGWSRAADVIATVAVSERSADNELTAEVSYRQDAAGAEAYKGAAVFDNTFNASTVAAIAVSKKVAGGTPAVAGEVFEFELLDKDGNKVEGVDNVTVQAGGTAEFTGLKYSLADAGKTFEYTVHEVGHNDKGWKADSDVKVTVRVAENADRTLAAEVSYGRGTNSAEFTNTYATSGKATFGVYKTVNGGTEAKPDEVFSFELYKADQNGNKTGKALEKVETEAGQVMNFPSWTCTAEGTYKFVIHETGHNDKGWAAASDVVVTVVATDNGDGTLKLETTYSRSAEGVAGFDNTYAASGKATIKVSKTVNGGSDAKEGEFFEFELLDKDGNEVEGVDNVKVQAGGTAEFTGLKYSFADAGKEFEYTVREVGHNTNGWTAASDVPVSVEVSDNGDGTLSAKASYPGDAVAAEFDNIYEVAPATAAPSVLKTVKTNDGRAWEMQAGQFSFELCDATGMVLQTKPNDANGVVDFDLLSFGAPGTYTYRVREGAVSEPLAQTIERDATVYTVTYVVGEKNDGTENARDLEVKSVAVTSSSAIDVDAGELADQGLSFVNVEKPGASKQPTAPKAPEAPKGTDALKAAGAAKGGKTPQTGDVTSNILSVAAAAVGLAFMAATLHRRRED